MGWKKVRAWLAPYAVAVASVALAIGLKECVDPFVEQDLSPFLFFAGPVVFTAWFGGVWPGLFCVSLVGMLASSLFFGSDQDAVLHGNGGLVRLALFLLEGVLISVLAGAMHGARRRAQQSGSNLALAYQESQRHVEELTRTKDALLDAQTGLRRAIADSQIANRAKSDFLANVSHELRTPLNAIIGMTDLCLQEPISGEVRENLTVSRESASMLLRLLNDLLDFSKIEAGRFDLDATPFCLRRSLEDVFKVLGLHAQDKGLEITLAVHPETPDCLVGDATRLEQVVANLLGNALKFTERGGVSVEVQVQSAMSRKTCLLFCVSDSGIGISAADQARIFAPFTQVDPSSTRQYEGIGLGLAITSQLVSAMEGRIWVESEIGRGSKFCFTAWFDLASEDATAAPIDLARLRDVPVLIVDEHTTNRRVLRDQLRHWGLRPALAANALQAWARLQRDGEGHPYPIVLLDASSADGFEFARRIRRDFAQITETVLMLPAGSDADGLRNGEKDDFVTLVKPASPAEIAAALLAAYSKVTASDERSFPARRCSRQAPANILLVEDTPANQRVMIKILEKQGYRVVAANDGREALERCAEMAFDAIVMDVQMPAMDGFQATAAIRQLPPPTGSVGTSPDTIVIALTAHATRGFEERCLAAGMDAYLSKPVDSGRLIELIESFLTGRASDGCQNAAEADPAIPSEPVAISNAIDYDSALERLDGNRTLLADMATFFLEDAPALLDRIDAGLVGERWDEVQRAAHSLKGLASNFGAARTIEVARQIEEAAEFGYRQQIVEQLPELHGCVRDLSHALRAPRE